MNGSRQTTLSGSIEFKGIGLHKGLPVSLKIEPADAGTGIVFEVSGVRIPAVVSNAVVSARNTELSANGKSIYTVEHILSALNGMGVDNARVILDAEEPPALDGSAAPLALAIRNTGITELSEPREFLKPEEPVICGEGGAFVIFLPASSFRATYILDYSHPLVGRQIADCGDGADEYLASVAPARTFGLIEEVETLRKNSLALGGSTENAVVVYPDSYSSPLRFEDEFARHKLLDLRGDLALLGRRLIAHCIATRSGHALNVKSVHKLIDSVEK